MTRSGVIRKLLKSLTLVGMKFCLFYDGGGLSNRPPPYVLRQAALFLTSLEAKWTLDSTCADVPAVFTRPGIC